MAGSHTVMPGILLSGNTVLNVTSTSGIVNNQQTVTVPLNHATLVNGGFGINGHSNNVITTSTMITPTSILRPANKIIVQGTPTTLAIINSPSNNLMNNSLCSVMQTNNNRVIERDAGHDYCATLSRVPDELIHHIKDENGHSSDSYASREVKVERPRDDVIKVEESLEEEQEEEEEEPVIDIMINNVVCSFSVGCHLDLRNIALTARHVEFRKENGMVTLKLRRPLTTASIWSSGKITCTGSTSEDQARIAARRVARSLQKLGYSVRFRNYRIVNVLGTCTMPFAIKISQFSQMHKRFASYEPELHPGVTYRIESPKATLKIFSTGSITVTAPSVSNVQSAIETIYPLVKEFSKPRSQEELFEIKKLQKRSPLIGDSDEEDIEESEEGDLGA